MPNNPLREAISLFTQLEELEQRQQTAATDMADLFAAAHATGEEKIADLLDDSATKSELQGELEKLQAEQHDLDYLRESGLVNAELISKREQDLQERANMPRFRMAARFLGSMTVRKRIEADEVKSEVPPDTEATTELIEPERFFERTPHKVAKDLVNKELKVGHNKGTIAAAKPQTAEDNASWVGKRPLFGENPVDVYVAPYRGNFMLFLRTGEKNTCVRIDQLELDGVVYKNPGQVCRALGLDEERTGRVAFDGKIVRILR
jgi:hypothetical protein